MEAGKVTHVETETRRMWRYKGLPEQPSERRPLLSGLQAPCLADRSGEGLILCGSQIINSQMHEKEQTKARLPLPKWCFVLLAVPTFYMPLAYLTVGAWAIGALIMGQLLDPPPWMMSVIGPALYVTFVMWPVYVAWVGRSRRLTWREKGWWLLIVVLLNMIGMPMFFVFMIRRYLGVEGRTTPRDEAALDSLLATCGTDRQALSEGQLFVLRRYCRTHRLNKWSTLPLLAIAGLCLYVAIVFVPELGMRLSSGFAPTRVVIVDASNDSKKEIEPDPEGQRLQVKIIMMMGAIAGMWATGGLLALALAVSQVRGNWHRKAFIEYLEATDGKHLTGPSI